MKAIENYENGIPFHLVLFPTRIVHRSWEVLGAINLKSESLRSLSGQSSTALRALRKT
jgi:hypothetical protein